jgi:hypothetical protein
MCKYQCKSLQGSNLRTKKAMKSSSKWTWPLSVVLVTGSSLIQLWTVNQDQHKHINLSNSSMLSWTLLGLNIHLQRKRHKNCSIKQDGRILWVLKITIWLFLPVIKVTMALLVAQHTTRVCSPFHVSIHRSIQETRTFPPLSAQNV